jgi:uncharacterized protein YndB with AHSA1/START domain
VDRVAEESERETIEQVERETVLDADADRAWEAISDPAMLERWLADEVSLEPVEGSPARFTVDGEERHGRVERVVEGSEFAFTWERQPGDASVVRFELTPCVSGTRIVVTETRLTPGAPIAMSGGWSGALLRASQLLTLVLA